MHPSFADFYVNSIAENGKATCFYKTAKPKQTFKYLHDNIQGINHLKQYS